MSDVHANMFTELIAAHDAVAARLNLTKHENESYTAKETEHFLVQLMPTFTGNWRLVLTPKTATAGWDDGWCFSSILLAYAAALTWEEDGPEPYGWFRHLTTGRRRPNGDPTQEYISP